MVIGTWSGARACVERGIRAHAQVGLECIGRCPLCGAGANWTPFAVSFGLRKGVGEGAGVAHPE